MLDVHRRDDADARGEERLDVLPALLVPAAGRVRVREFVDEGDVGGAGDHRVEVHVVEGDPAVLDDPAGDDLEPVDQGGGGGTLVGLDDGDHHVAALGLHAVPFLEHRERLADAGGRAEQDPQFASLHGLILSLFGRWWGGGGGWRGAVARGGVVARRGPGWRWRLARGGSTCVCTTGSTSRHGIPWCEVLPVVRAAAARGATTAATSAAPRPRPRVSASPRAPGSARAR